MIAIILHGNVLDVKKAKKKAAREMAAVLSSANCKQLAKSGNFHQLK